MEISWSFTSVDRTGQQRDVNPTTTGTMSYDDSAAVRKTLTGLVFLPDQLNSYDPTTDYLLAYLTLDDVTYLMGAWYPNAISYQKDATTDDAGGYADLTHIDFGDGFVKLAQTPDVTVTASPGDDPALIIQDLVNTAGFDSAVARPLNHIATFVNWSPFTSMQSIIDSLAPLLGQRPAWIDRFNTFRSVAALVAAGEVITLESLLPQAGSIVITDSYLTAPNRIIVNDPSQALPIYGQWDAPASAPHSFAKRGYRITQQIQQQGVLSSSQAADMAKTLGEQATARRLNAVIPPTYLLDGPTVLSYLDSLWIVRSWSMGTATGSMQSFAATEYIG